MAISSPSCLVCLLAAAGILVGDVTGFGSGSFNGKEYDACVLLNATGHGVVAETSPCPFGVDVPRMYTPGKSLTVTLWSPSGASFKGFMLQARRVDTMERVGEFTAVQGTKLNCQNTGGKALSHSSDADKQNLSVTWTAPEPGVGKVKFLFTIVEEQTSFWTNQTSSEMDQDMMRMPTALPDIDVSQCGQSLSCYLDASDCTTDCKVIVTWSKEGDDKVNFDVETKASSENEYIAIGFSKNDEMGDDSVVDCIHSSNQNQVRVQMSYNKGRSNMPLKESTLGLEPSKSIVTYKDGKLRCRFTRYISLNTSSDESDKVFTLDKPYRLLIAKGPVDSSGSKQKHTDVSYSSFVDVSLNEIFEIGEEDNLDLVKTHGVLMILAWMISASIAILMPRYYKKAWPGKEMCKKPIWFQLHQPLMVITFLLTIIAFIIIFVSAGEYADYPSLPENAHPPLGIVTTCLVVINPIMAAFRPAPGAVRRVIFNRFHFSVGEGAHICSVATIFLSLYMAKVNVPDWSKWIMVAYICWHVLVEFMLQLYGCKSVVASPEKYEMNAVNYPDELEARQPDTKTSSFQTFVIVLHVIVVVGLSLVLIILIARN